MKLIGLLFFLLMPNLVQITFANEVKKDSTMILLMAEDAFKWSGSDHAKARQLCDSIKQLSNKYNYPVGIAIALDIEGNLLRKEGNYNKAIKLHLHALRMFEETNSKNSHYISCLVNTGTDYFYLQNLQGALHYYMKALPFIQQSDYRRLAAVYNNIGSVYNALGEYNKAIAIYKKAIPTALADTTHHAPATLFSSLGIALAQTGDRNQSITYLLKALTYQKKAGLLHHYASTCNTLSGIYIDLKKYTDARLLLNEGYHAALKVNARSVIANFYRNMGLLCKNTKKPDEAYEWQNRYINLNDSLINEAHISELAESEAKYKIDLKNQEIALMKAENNLKTGALKESRLWSYALGTSLVAAFILALLFYNYYQLKKKANQLLLLENQQLNAENTIAQYQLLRSQVDPHFLFNSLNTLQTLVRTDRDKANEFINAFSRLYRAVLEQNHHTVIPLSEDLKLAYDYFYLQKIRFGEGITLTQQLSPHTLSLLIPPFCVQILLENAIKHNMADVEMPLRIHVSADEHFLYVRNNFQPRKEYVPATGTGLKNITNRIQLLCDELPTFEIVNNEYLAKIPLIPAVL